VKIREGKTGWEKNEMKFLNIPRSVRAPSNKAIDYHRKLSNGENYKKYKMTYIYIYIYIYIFEVWRKRKGLVQSNAATKSRFIVINL